jgi:hypothetical protein
LGQALRLSAIHYLQIKSGVKPIYFINSTNGPYGFDDKQGRAMFDKLGGTQIIQKRGTLAY